MRKYSLTQEKNKRIIYAEEQFGNKKHIHWNQSIQIRLPNCRSRSFLNIITGLKLKFKIWKCQNEDKTSREIQLGEIRRKTVFREKNIWEISKYPAWFYKVGLILTPRTCTSFGNELSGELKISKFLQFKIKLDFENEK